MRERKRSKREVDIDTKTAGDTLDDAALDRAFITFPRRKKKIALNMRVEPEIVAITKKIAALKHLDGYTQLLRMYIWEGVEKDRSLLRKVGLA